MTIDLANAPERILKLPRDQRGIPVPWFAAWTEDGTPNFVTADGEKVVRAIKEKLCWVCGEPLGRFLAFVIGPMCTVNRATAEPPSHRDCAEFSLHHCPFLINPNMKRLPAKYLEGHDQPGGIMLERNPGVSALWMTLSYRIVSDRKGSFVLRLGDPVEVTWWAEGRPATELEVCHSLAEGLPFLIKLAKEDGEKALADLQQLYERALQYIPKTKTGANGG